ncbi:hypothetical protein ND486_03375 [Pseudonocardia sp. DR1-2]|uniref:hypothetical protein n=1 Tax=Pseudonocardia sp. DR1-2 TaxID=2951168 RepID=UPI0020446904|nr:hypothetical protein [Pseudonocardia sp. DR1-2]MCM3845233.1 hypothetical protein [Pseudonocardia sp. DR1-2]
MSPRDTTADTGRRLDRIEGELTHRPTRKDLAALRDGQGRQVQQVERHERRLGTLAREVEELGAALEAVRRRSVRAAKDAAARVDELTTTVADQAGRIERLHGELVRLDDRMRVATGVPDADLTPTGADRELAATVLRGREHDRARLGDADRAARRHDAAGPERWERERAAAVRAVLDASRAVADGTDGTAALAGRFRAARDRLDTVRAAEGDVRAAADRARTELDADAERELRDGTVVAEGRDAGTALTGRLRERLVAAVDAGHRLPPWFTTALGSGPPAPPEDWYETAVALLTHRVLYGIGDTASALGPPDGPAERAAEHSALARRMRPYGLR